jgi:phosphoribosylformylglycinamidine synthase
MATPAFRAPGEAVVVVGATGGHLGASLYLREVLGREDGAPPPVDLAAERRNGDFVRGLIVRGSITACHDVSDGGLLVAVAEMAMAGGLGARLRPVAGRLPLHAFLFGEDQGRYVVTVPPAGLDAVLAGARAAGVPATILGETGGDLLSVADGHAVAALTVADLRRVNEGWLPAYMSAPDAH